MSLTIDELYSNLIARWKEAFERFPKVEAAAANGSETVYATVPAFALSGYTPRKFKPGARLSKTPSGNAGNFTYLLDTDGRPLQMHYTHPHNRTSSCSVYHYKPSEVECLEFCLETQVPSLYNRLILDNGAILAEQRFVCNSGGSSYKLLPLHTAAEKIETILGDKHEYFAYLTLYHLENGVTQSAEEYHEVAGKIYRPTLRYSYAADGKLDRIVQHWPGGEQRTTFAAKTKTSSKELSVQLSEKVAQAILAQLRQTAYSSPLTLLELCYREHEGAVPMLVPLRGQDPIENLALSAQVDAKEWISLSAENFEPELTDFRQRAEATENSDAVAKMLRAAARQVTERARAELPVASDFVAFAIDWELEGDELGKILKQCGATPERLREWKKKNFL